MVASLDSSELLTINSNGGITRPQRVTRRADVVGGVSLGEVPDGEVHHGDVVAHVGLRQVVLGAADDHLVPCGVWAPWECGMLE